MRRSTAAICSVLWFVAIGGTFGCLLPYLLTGIFTGRCLTGGSRGPWARC